MNESWMPVIGWEDCYEVSDLGRVRSLPRAGRRGRILRPSVQPEHYPSVTFSRKSKLTSYGIHRLVLAAFVGPCPEGMEACHNNGDWHDCRLVNLRWDTRKNNHADKRVHGKHNGGVRHYRAKFTAGQVAEIRAAHGSYAKLAQRYGVSVTCIGKIKSGKSYVTEAA